MNIVIKDLDSKLVERANNNSLNGKRGEQEEHDYQLYCKKAISWNLSERKTQKIINKIYTSKDCVYFKRCVVLGVELDMHRLRFASTCKDGRLTG